MIGAIPVDSTLLVVEMPDMLLNFISLKQCFVSLLPMRKMVVIRNSEVLPM